MNKELREILDSLIVYLCESEDCECEPGDEGQCALCQAQRAQELLAREP